MVPTCMPLAALIGHTKHFTFWRPLPGKIPKGTVGNGMECYCKQKRKTDREDGRNGSIPRIDLMGVEHRSCQVQWTGATRRLVMMIASSPSLLRLRAHSSLAFPPHHDQNSVVRVYSSCPWSLHKRDHFGGEDGKDFCLCDHVY